MLGEYENNIKSLVKTVTSGIDDLESNPDMADEADALIDKIRADIRSARAELTKFKSYTRGLGRADKDVAVAQYGNLEKMVSIQKRRLDTIENKYNADALAGSSGSKYRDVVDEQNHMLERSSDRLQSVKTTLAETEDHASTITSELDRNRRTLLGAKEKVDGTQMELKGAGRILNRMFVRNVAQRASIFGMLIIGGIIVLIVLVACLATPGLPEPIVTVVTTAAPVV